MAGMRISSRPEKWRIYTVLGDAGVLYIGCSRHVKGRTQFHRLHSWWWRLATSVRLSKPMADKSMALGLERRLIHDLRPWYNVQRRRLAQCGTVAGHAQHYRHGEKPCDLCQQAHRDYQRDRRNVTET